MSKLNCWEFMDCGRNVGGRNVAELGVCPVSKEVRMDGVHGGANAGRSCWVVSGTLCKGEVQGSFAKKFKNCEACNFYRTVKSEEFPHFKLSAVLVNRMS